MSKFDELKKLAEAVVPIVVHNNFDKYPDGWGTANPTKEQADFMSAANPAAILELLAIKAQLLEALKGLDDSFCSINEFSTKEERNQARRNLIAARAAIVAAEVQP